MLQTLRRRVRDEKGFTLIELLVVILIIGVLAAIAIPSFLGQRTKATDTEAKTGARTAATAMETYFVDKQTYEGADTGTLQAIEPTLNDLGKRLTVRRAAEKNYVVTVVSNRDAGRVSFSLVRNPDGTTTRSCRARGVSAGGCKAGTW